MEDHSELQRFMRTAVEEAEQSLREGNCGFGAVIARNGELVSRAHDSEKSSNDPTAHAEMSAIRMAASELGRDLRGCVIVSTHEPCPMCAGAIIWAGIESVVYGYGIEEALREGRRRIDLPCREVFERSGRDVTIVEGVLHDACAVLYNEAVRRHIDLLRGADEARLCALADELTAKRLAWFDAHPDHGGSPGESLLDGAYRLFLRKLGLSEADAPIVARSESRLVIRSRNFCPTLEACRLLGLDTGFVCRHLTEGPTDALLKASHPSLHFTRNYGALRPAAPWCEEMISIED